MTILEKPAVGVEKQGKGLSLGKVGLVGAVMIGISCIAPSYTLTSGLGPTISAVGAYAPAIFILGFIPMLLVAFAYRELNNRMPDSGTTFTWVTKAFGPWVGWMAGWGLIAATICVLSNLAAVAVDFFFLLIGEVSGRPELAELAQVTWINIPMTILFLLLASGIAYRGLDATQNLQAVLVVVQIAALSLFIGFALYKAYTGGGFDFTPVSASWFNPLAAGGLSVIVAGVSLSIFMFWGWDVTLTMNEETKDPEKTPARAATVTVFITIALYILTAVAVVAWAGTGTEGLGAGNPDNQESIFAALAHPVMGPWSILMSLSILASSFASLQSTMVSPARTMLAMGYYEALPPSFAKVSPRFHSPSTATLASVVATSVFYTATRLISENALWDTISALGLMVCFYYGMTALACVWYFRHEAFTSARDFTYKLVCPLLGGLALMGMFALTAYDSIDPDYGSGSSTFGVGNVFVLGMGVLGLGAVVMVWVARRHPAFFRGEVIRRASSLDDAALEA